MWRFYNLLTGSYNSPYIDSFLDRNLNVSEIAMDINVALHNDEIYNWFIDQWANVDAEKKDILWNALSL